MPPPDILLGCFLVCTSDDDCFSGGCDGAFYDGTALAVFDGAVWFAAQNVDERKIQVWKTTGRGILEFDLFIDFEPFDEHETIVHPRFRTFQNRLYIMAQRRLGNRNAMATFIEAGSSTWATPRIVSFPIRRLNGIAALALSDRTIGFANQFSFDVGVAAETGEVELRTLHTRESREGKLFLDVVACDADLIPLASDPLVADCRLTGWTTEETPGDQFAPLLYRNSSGGGAAEAPAVWKAVWLSRESDPDGNIIEVREGNLATVGTPQSGFSDVLVELGLVAPQVPCSASDPNNTSEVGYWGHYNDLTQLVMPSDFAIETRFVAPFTRNGTNGECDFRNTWTADMHVGAVVFQ